MSLDQLRTSLYELLGAVASQQPSSSGRVESADESVCIIPMPRDLVGAEASQGSLPRLPRFTGDAAERYFDCREELLQQGVDGEFEHLAQRDIERALQRLVCEAWLANDSLPPSDRRARADRFIDAHRRPHESWDVFWEIRNLDVHEAFTVSDVEFLPFDGAIAERRMRREGHQWPALDEQFVGKTLARATVYAGSRKRALERAKIEIDDALNVLRVLLLPARLVRDQQRLQRRGIFYLICRTREPDELDGGGEREFEPYTLGIGGVTLELVRDRMADLEHVISEQQPAEIREPMLRAIHWIGSSVTHELPDDKVIDLCTALECILCTAAGPPKAAQISVRYMLAGFAIGESVYVVHPLDVYELYQNRNKIVHGSARRVCNIQDAIDLRYVAVDALDRMSTLVQAHRDLTSLGQAFDHIKTEPGLTEISSFLLEERMVKEDHEVCKLTKSWLAQVRQRNF